MKLSSSETEAEAKMMNILQQKERERDREIVSYQTITRFTHTALNNKQHNIQLLNVLTEIVIFNSINDGKFQIFFAFVSLILLLYRRDSANDFSQLFFILLF